MRRFWLLATIAVGIATIVKALHLALTPEAWAVLSRTGRALLESDAFGFLFVTTAILGLFSLVALALDRAGRRRKADEARRALDIRLACEVGESIAELEAVMRRAREAAVRADGSTEENPNA